MNNEAEFNRRLTLLKAEVGIDYVGILQALEAGLDVLLVTNSKPEVALDPENLRRIGGLVMLCQHYGTSVLLIREARVNRIKLIS